MERFIRRENIKRYRKLLREAKDDVERRRILKLLAEEERKEGRFDGTRLKTWRAKTGRRSRPRAG